MITYIIITTIIELINESIKERRAKEIKREEEEKLKRDWENKTGVYWYLNSANKEKFEKMLKESE